jgi:hypothetical protein
MVGELAPQQLSERLLNDRSPAHELHDMNVVELGKRVERTGDRCPGSEITTHGVQRDARQL